MDFTEVIRTRRSIRSYKRKDIPDEVLGRILEAARIAPSGGNRQPSSFVVVRDPERKKQIAEACYEQPFIASAPVVVVCCSKRYPNRYEPWKDEAYLADAIIAVDHLVLAARNEGVGSCWIGAVHALRVKEIVRVPKDVDVVMVIPLGYPESASAFCERGGRKPLEEICFDEESGKPRTG